MFPEGPPVPSCDLFDEVQTFVRECPLSANYGCLTQIQGKTFHSLFHFYQTHLVYNNIFLFVPGKKMTKTCSDIDIEDCKTANKVKYCYCKGDLCNRERESLEEIGDDEDFGTDKLSQEEQGSGFSATVAEDDDDALLSRGIFTTSESNFSTTTTETNILATTTFSFEEKTLNVSSRLKKLDLLILILFVVLYLLR